MDPVWQLPDACLAAHLHHCHTPTFQLVPKIDIRRSDTGRATCGQTQQNSNLSTSQGTKCLVPSDNYQSFLYPNNLLFPTALSVFACLVFSPTIAQNGVLVKQRPQGAGAPGTASATSLSRVVFDNRGHLDVLTSPVAPTANMCIGER